MSKIITIEKEVQIGNKILEKGDRIKVLREATKADIHTWALDSIGNLYYDIDEAKRVKDVQDLIYQEITDPNADLGDIQDKIMDEISAILNNK